jgi:hypothetical protein
MPFQLPWFLKDDVYFLPCRENIPCALCGIGKWLHRAMADSASCQGATAGARVQSRAIPCQTDGGVICSATGFSYSTSVFLISIIPPTLQTHFNLNISLIRTSGRSLGTFVVEYSSEKWFNKWNNYFPIIIDRCCENHTKYGIYIYIFIFIYLYIMATCIVS